MLVNYFTFPFSDCTLYVKKDNGHEAAGRVDITVHYTLLKIIKSSVFNLFVVNILTLAVQQPHNLRV